MFPEDLPFVVGYFAKAGFLLLARSGWITVLLVVFRHRQSLGACWEVLALRA